MFKIEKSVPIPASKRYGQSPKYPLADLKVSETCLVPAKTTGEKRLAQVRLASSIHNRRPKEFTTAS